MSRLLLLFCLCFVSSLLADGAEPESEIRQALISWSEDFNNKNIPAVCSLFAPDLVAEYPGAPDRNYEEMCRHFAKILSDPTQKYTYSSPQIHQIILDRDLAIVRLEWTLKTPTETVIENGLDVFRLQEDGSWKIAISYAYPAQPHFSLEMLSAYIEKERLRFHVPGAAIVIVQEGEIVFSQGFGRCRYDRPEKVDENTIFQLGSVAKTFTAAGLGIMVDRGKLGWDDEIIMHLPQFKLKDAYATRNGNVIDLLAHRTGLPSFSGDLLGKLGYSPAEVLQRIRFIVPETSFRNRANYSNVGYFAAGELLAALSHQPFQRAIQNLLLDPLEMRNSGFADKLDGSNVAYSHAFASGQWQLIRPDKGTVFAAAGGVVSTAKDLGNWMIMHLNKGAFKGREILCPDTVTKIHSPSMVSQPSFSELPPIDENASFSFGLGWDNYQYRGKYIVEKGGALEGVRSLVTLIPELKLGIAVLANLNLTVFPEVIRAHILDGYLGGAKDWDEIFDKCQADIDKLIEAPARPKNAQPPCHPLNDYTGHFSNELYGEFVVSVKGESLQIEAGPAHLLGKLIPWDQNTFILEWPYVNAGHEKITFIFNSEGELEGFQSKELNFSRL